MLWVQPQRSGLFNILIKSTYLLLKCFLLRKGLCSLGHTLTHLQPASTVLTPTNTNNLNNGVNYIGNFSFKSPVLPTAGGQNHWHYADSGTRAGKTGLWVNPGRGNNHLPLPKGFAPKPATVEALTAVNNSSCLELPDLGVFLPVQLRIQKTAGVTTISPRAHWH